MFSGIKVLFAGISSAQRKIFEKRFVELRGIVATREKIHPIFKPKQLNELEDDIDYIIVENKMINKTELCRHLHCPDIPRDTSVIHKEWLEQCLHKKSKLEIENYLVNLTPNDIIPSPQESSTSTIEISSANRKRKQDDCSDTCRNQIKQIKIMKFICLDSAAKYDKEYNTFLSDSGKPALLFKFSQVCRPEINRIIAFDMDGTLITTKSGAKFAKNKDDWKFLYPCVAEALRREYESGALIAIISNQNGLAKGHTTMTELIEKAIAISNTIGVPMDIFFAFENDIYRKPRIGSFNFFLNNRIGGSINLDDAGHLGQHNYEATRDPNVLANCLYVGDAAGRVKHGTRKKDFSASDYKMAINAGIRFETPEEFFLNSKQPLHCSVTLRDLGPSWNDIVRDNERISPAMKDLQSENDINIPEIILLVGPPACGKSSLARKLNRTHVRINQDILKTKKACFDVARNHFSSLGNHPDDGPKGVVVDATNSTRSTRKEWIDFAKDQNVPISCIYFQVSKELCLHLAAYRMISPLSLEEDKRNIEQVVIHSYFKHMEPPKIEEGFVRVEDYGFYPVLPTDEVASRLLTSYLR